MRNLWVLGYLTGIFTIRKLTLQAHVCVQTSPSPTSIRPAICLPIVGIYPSYAWYLVDPWTRKPANTWAYAADLEGVSESRQIRGLSLPSKVFSISYFIRFLRSTCYKLLTTLNEWVKTHTWSMFIPCDWHHLQTTDICNSSEHLLNIVIQSVGEF
jgi:hypothetical protein